MARNHQLEEPDVTPLINVNLVVLVMALLISSHAARLLPLRLPRLDTSVPRARGSVALKVTAGGYRIADADVAPADLPAAVDGLAQGATVVVSAEEGASPEAVGYATDCLMKRPELQVYVDDTDAVHLRVEPNGYRLDGATGLLTREALAGRVAEIGDRQIVMVSLASDARYEQLVAAMDLLMVRPGLKVSFGDASPE